MGEHILKISIDELTVVRVTCKHCRVVTERPIELLGAQTDCPHCKRAFVQQPRDAIAFNQLADGIKKLAALSDAVGVEFVIPVKAE